MKKQIFTQANTLLILDEQESLSIRNKWISIFCQNKQGANIKSFLWHIFSNDRYPSLDGSAARNEYMKHIATQYFVMPNDTGAIIVVDTLPISCNHSDYYIFPANMAWTMAFTHEEGWLGPYFAKHKNYTALNKINEQQREKITRIEIARKNGWC